MTLTPETLRHTLSTSEVERHPGPFIGPDAELARACAMAVIPWYGNDDTETHQRILKNGIWNDHVAVQAALAAIHNARNSHERLTARVAELEGALRNLLQNGALVTVEGCDCEICSPVVRARAALSAADGGRGNG